MRFMRFMCCNPFSRFFTPKPTTSESESKSKSNINVNINELLPVDIKWEDTVAFTFPITQGRVIKVYDADTITISAKLPYEASPLYRLSVRLNGIDTAELKSKLQDEKDAAKSAQIFVSNLLLHKIVRLENVQSEKYGRILADVYVDNINVNQLLLKERYAVQYDGGTKIKPTSWIKYKLTGELV